MNKLIQSLNTNYPQGSNQSLYSQINSLSTQVTNLQNLFKNLPSTHKPPATTPITSFLTTQSMALNYLNNTSDPTTLASVASTANNLQQVIVGITLPPLPTTPPPPTPVYYGAYRDGGSAGDDSGQRAIPNFRGANLSSVQACQQLAQQNGDVVFGLQAGNECWTGKDIDLAAQWGRVSSSGTLGGAWNNEVYALPQIAPPIGHSIACAQGTAPPGASTEQNAVYRYMGNNQINLYPNTTIASSWDSTWMNPIPRINCSAFKQGPPLPSPRSYIFQGAVDYPGNDITYWKGPFSNCAAACDVTPGCVAYVSDLPNGSNCWLKSKLENSRQDGNRNTNYVAGTPGVKTPPCTIM